MSLFSKLFGGSGGSEPKIPPETYEGFTITPTPIKESSGYRISARIEKKIDGEVKSHTIIRADTIEDPKVATEASLRKAKQVIDEQGARLFD
jgi:hypothetical protein